MRLLFLLTLCVAANAHANLKLYVMNCGELSLNDVSAFGLTNEDTDVRNLFVPCYLVDHPDGQLLFDAGLPLNIAGQGEVPYGEGATMTYPVSVLDQLAELDIAPTDVEYLAMSHSHFDHAGAANAFAASTLLIQEPEYVAAFQNAAEYEVFVPELYAELRSSTKLLLNGDHDVFGDGSVILVSTPGHTPGHQVLLLHLKKTGPLILSGDLYHFRFSREHRRTPVFNTNAEQTLASMDRVEALLKELDATLWIEHDYALAQTLDMSPSHYD